MKKALSLFFAFVMAIVALPVSVYAEDEASKSGYEYAFIDIQGKDAWGCHNGKWYYKTWTGKEITPEIRVSLYGFVDNGRYTDAQKDLVEGQDYELTFGNNRDMGYCRLNITGTGDYSDFDIVKVACNTSYEPMTEEDFELIIGTDYVKGPIFVIRPLGTRLNKVTPQKKAVKVTWKRQAKKMSVKRITGYQLQLSTRKDFETYRLVTVKGYKNTSKVVKKLKGKKKYYVRIRTYYQCKDGFKAYSTWSKAKVVTTKR